MPSKALELEAAVKALPGVLGCVIMTDGDGNPHEVQAFVRAGVDQALLQQAIREEVARVELDPWLEHVYVFELEAESHFGDRESVERAAELAEQDARARGPRAGESQPEPPPEPERSGGKLPARPVVDRVVLTSSSWTSESQVSLRLNDRSYHGSAEGEKTSHGLKVLAQATLEASAKLAERLTFELQAASVVSLDGRQAVLVLVRGSSGLETLGAALVREGPISEATVRATLAAINRKLAQEIG